ncbi:MAG TPA: hypothetical protein VE825_00315, partial [Terriglobales bacterium]|nr:hypothetical protein [Terriglobales bacterium]
MSQPPISPAPGPPITTPPSEPTLLHKVFVGRGGIRAGWRLLIFFAILFALGAAANLAVRLATRGRLQPGTQELSPGFLLLGEGSQFALLLLATFLMSRIEKRRLGEYGLALGRGFRKTFWEGAFYGFGGISLVLAVMHFTGHYDFGTLALHGGAIFRSGALFLVGFLGVGFFEEYSFRGYFLYTLTDGFSGLGPIRPGGGFLIAAVLVSA